MLPEATGKRYGLRDAANPHWAAVIGMVALALTAPRALAKDYPTRTVTIVAPSVPGGMYSILAPVASEKSEFVHIDGVTRQGSGTRRCVRTARLRVCRPRPSNPFLMLAKEGLPGLQMADPAPAAPYRSKPWTGRHQCPA
jgi:hypothetical protein